jgi:signal transduction histidine kinase
MLAAVWIPVVLIGLMHYVTGAQHHWIHDILRRLYYLPIVLAAFQRGLPGGLLAAAVVSVTYLPHAFFFHARPDPAPPVEKALELVLYHAVGGVAGWLADQERRRTAELREALAEQRRLQRQLVRAGRLSALGEVVAGIAHEIKNPLHALKGTAEVVDPLVPAEAEERRLWERHRAELQRLGDVAERFLSFARPRRLASDRVDLREVVERLQDLVAAEARQQGLTLTTELPPRPVFVSGDRDQLAQVGLNIVINAFHALRAQGTLLRLGVGRGRPGPGPAEPGPAEVQGVGGNRRTMAYLRIENDGPPIPEVALEHIFDPFHSGDEEGTGLGLSISARIAEQHGGFIEVANAQPGVVFTVWLPPAPTG